MTIRILYEIPCVVSSPECFRIHIFACRFRLLFIWSSLCLPSTKEGMDHVKTFASPYWQRHWNSAASSLWLNHSNTSNTTQYYTSSSQAGPAPRFSCQLTNSTSNPQRIHSWQNPGINTHHIPSTPLPLILTANTTSTLQEIGSVITDLRTMHFVYCILWLAAASIILTASAPLPYTLQRTDALVPTRRASGLHSRHFSHWWHCNFGKPTGNEYEAPCWGIWSYTPGLTKVISGENSDLHWWNRGFKCTPALSLVQLIGSVFQLYQVLINIL